jgi:EmrB/QacA subfamily drug resistance transporter
MFESKNDRILLWLVAIAVFMETLDSTIVNTALPSMARSLGESPLHMYAIIMAYSLTLAMMIPASGWIADRFGTRKVFMTSISIFALGSLACACSQNLGQLIAARVLQGIGGSMMLPVGRLSVLRAFPRERYVRAISFVAVPGLVGPLVGPTLGGTLVEIASWHWIFLINLPIAIGGIVATYKYMKDYRSDERTRFDGAGFALLAICMVSMSLALDGLSELGLEQVTILFLVLVSLVCLCTYVLHANHKRYALLSLQLFRVRTFSVGLMGNMFARIGSGSMPFMIPLLLQLGLGYSPMRAGLLMVPVALASIISKPLALPLITRFTYRPLLIINTFLVGLAIASFAVVSEAYPLPLLIAQLTIFGFVNSLQFTAMNTVTLQDLETKRAASGNSLYSMVQMLSMSFGVAAAGALLSTFTAHFGEAPGAVHPMKAFHATFLCLGLFTWLSAVIFWQLSPNVRERART